MKPITDYSRLVIENLFMWGIWAQRLVYAVGIALSVWTYKKTKIKGYLLIAAFFTLPFISLITREISHEIHKEKLQLIADQRNKELEEMRERGEPVVVEQTINFPIFEILLIMGLFYVSKNHIKLCEQGS